MDSFMDSMDRIERREFTKYLSQKTNTKKKVIPHVFSRFRLCKKPTNSMGGCMKRRHFIVAITSIIPFGLFGKRKPAKHGGNSSSTLPYQYPIECKDGVFDWENGRIPFARIYDADGTEYDHVRWLSTATGEIEYEIHSLFGVPVEMPRGEKPLTDKTKIKTPVRVVFETQRRQ